MPATRPTTSTYSLQNWITTMSLSGIDTLFFFNHVYVTGRLKHNINIMFFLFLILWWGIYLFPETTCFPHRLIAQCTGHEKQSISHRLAPISPPWLKVLQMNQIVICSAQHWYLGGPTLMSRKDWTALPFKSCDNHIYFTLCISYLDIMTSSKQVIFFPDGSQIWIPFFGAWYSCYSYSGTVD